MDIGGDLFVYLVQFPKHIFRGRRKDGNMEQGAVDRVFDGVASSTHYQFPFVRLRATRNPAMEMGYVRILPCPVFRAQPLQQRYQGAVV